MSQMYRVKFTRMGEGTVETGDAVLNADNREQAIEITARVCNLAVSGTEYDVSRVKPAFLLVRRANVERHISTFEARTVAESLASNATFPRGDDLGRQMFNVAVRVQLHADSEMDAIAATSRVVMRHAKGERQKISLREFDITCEPVAMEEHVSRYDENAQVSVNRFFQGGAVRPR